IRQLEVIANERLSAVLFQNYVEMLHFTNISDLAKGIAQPLELIPAGHVSGEEAHAVLVLNHLLCFSPADDQSSYGGLRLVEWVRGYAALQQLARDSDDLIICLSYSE